jgi:RNA polymerase sigma factor (sigma-70 family)
VATISATTVGRDLNTLFAVGAVGDLSDADLLGRFVAGRGEGASEAAFSVIVARHGPMVLGVCERVLRNRHAADDAFQATFLILARKASTVRVEPGDSLGRWLYGVSVRVARRAKAICLAERALVREFHNVEPPDKSTSQDFAAIHDLREVIDGAIARLPRRYRSVVVLCYLEGLTQEEAASRLRCPVGTIRSRLHRARNRLRSSLTRRGLAPAVTGSTLLAGTTTKANVPPALAQATIASAGRLCAGGALAGTVSTAILTLVRMESRSMIMNKGLWALLLSMAAGLTATGAIALGHGPRDDPKAPAPPADPSKVDTAVARSSASIADRFAKIRAEYDAKNDALMEAQAKVKGQREHNKLYQTMAPDEAAYSRRVVDLVLSSPSEPAARDALTWVLNKVFMFDYGPYGDEFSRAAALLVRHHADDPDAVRVGLGLGEGVTAHRDILLMQLYATAKSREAKGLARLALAQYLEMKAKFIRGVGNSRERRKNVFIGFIDDDDKVVDKAIPESDEEYAYRMELRLYDPDAVQKEAERLYEEVIAEDADVPHITLKIRELEAIRQAPKPSWNGKPLTTEELGQLDRILAQKATLGEVAHGRLDDLRNLVNGKPAPSIEGVDLEGKPLSLSDHRGKVVVLSFWGSWCGPCMREVPTERELVERYKDKPFVLLGVNCGEDKQAALEAVANEKITWRSWHDGDSGEGPIVKRYHVRKYPTFFIIDGDGRISAKDAPGSKLKELVDALFKKEGHEGRG